MDNIWLDFFCESTICENYFASKNVPTPLLLLLLFHSPSLGFPYIHIYIYIYREKPEKPRFCRYTFLNFSSRRAHLCVRNALYFEAGLHILVPVPYPVAAAMLLLNMHKFPFCTGLLHLHLLFICRWEYWNCYQWITDSSQHRELVFRWATWSRIFGLRCGWIPLPRLGEGGSWRTLYLDLSIWECIQDIQDMQAGCG